MNVRPYNPDTDYVHIERLYKLPNSFGGQFDEARDVKEKLDALIDGKPGSILVATEGDAVVGTITLFEDGRSAWLYRFAVEKECELEIASALWTEAKKIMKQLGHSQILVYAPLGDSDFEKRYTSLGFNKGGDFTAYWQNLE